MKEYLIVIGVLALPFFFIGYFRYDDTLLGFGFYLAFLIPNLVCEYLRSKYK